MGKLKNPITDKIERDIEQAKISIDILELLQKKTKGNLEEYEEKMLKSVLQELRLNYVAERDKKDEDSTKAESDTTDETSDKPGSDTETKDNK